MIDPELDITKVEHKNYSSVKQVFYNMVPKCGSKSMRFVTNNLSFVHKFRTCQGFTQPYSTANYHLASLEILNTARGLLKLKEPWIYFKHLNYINFTIYKSKLKPVYINLVRDPIDRLESFFYYRRAINKRRKVTYHGPVFAAFFSGSSGADKYRRAKMTFSECILTSDPECTDVRFTWTIIPHFCGQHYICLTPTRNALNLAIKNVLTEYAVVGHVSKYVEFLEVLEVILPQYYEGAVDSHNHLKKLEKYSHKTALEAPKLSKEARDALMNDDTIKLEYEFYNFIIKRFKIVYKSYMGHKLS